MKILAQVGDLGGCYQYRIRIPFAALNKYDVSVDCYPFLPNNPGDDQFKTLVGLYSNYDAVLVQRCYIYPVVEQMKRACEFLGIPMIFETDDDYLNLPPTNPAYLAVIHPDFFIQHPNSTKEEIERERLRCLEGYKRILEMADLITVSTEELKRTLAPYNKNIVVLQNNLESVYLYRDHNPEHSYICREKGPNEGKMVIESKHGLWSIPDHYVVQEPGKNTAQAFQCPRIGYSGTISHRGNDFKTIEYYWEKLIMKRSKECWFVYLGDKNFWEIHERKRKERNLPPRNLLIPQYEYSLYMYNYRNLDVAIAPVYPNVFNMSKSDIKAVEAASWGIPCVLPNYVTYNRNFVHGENCLMYDNGKEFFEYAELLLGDPKLRTQLGQNALKYVAENRLERQHSKARYEAYKSVIDKSYKLEVYHPEASNEA